MSKSKKRDRSLGNDTFFYLNNEQFWDIAYVLDPIILDGVRKLKEGTLPYFLSRSKGELPDEIRSFRHIGKRFVTAILGYANSVKTLKLLSVGDTVLIGGDPSDILNNEKVLTILGGLPDVTGSQLVCMYVLQNFDKMEFTFETDEPEFLELSNSWRKLLNENTLYNLLIEHCKGE